MGKVTEWLRRLLGGRRKTASDGKEKKGWGFVRSLRDKEPGARKVVGGYGRNGSSYTDVDPRCCPAPCNAPGGNGGSEGAIARAYDEEEQSKRAIAMAAATAAVAEAAVAAAQAAAAVVRLTSRKAAHGGVPWRREEWAAIKIQSAFRGYLGRRALKALKGLVKIQALVRGHIVRKQAAETLRCMHALVRAQARARVGRTVDNQLSDNRGSKRHSFRNVSSAKNVTGYWLEERYWDTRESTTRTSRTADEKILEIDAGRPRANPKWRSIHHSKHPDPNSHSFTTLPESPSKDSTAVQRSVPSPSSVDMQPSLGSIMFPLEGGEYTESPQFYSASSRHGSSRRGPFTPSKSECSRSLFGGYSDYPNYMANTESSRAKLRSQSAPRQRPEREKSGCVGPAHRGGSGPGSLHLKFAGKAYPGSGRLDRMGLPVGV